MRMAGQLFVLSRLLSLSILVNLVSSEAILKQVIVVTRHGSRFPLGKNPENLSEYSPAMLTAFGQKQMYDLGVWLRTNYASSGIFNAFDSKRMRFESSSFERTVTSANSLALGLFEPAARDPNSESLLPVVPANIPVYTYEQENDMLLRSYDKCTTLQNRLRSLYKSAEWKQMENDNKLLLTQLASTTEFQPYSNSEGIVPLSQLWNVYDTIAVAKTECETGAAETSPTCESLPDKDAATLLSDTDWAKVQELAHEAEVLKYGRITAGPMVGIMLLKEIVRRMENGDYTFSLFSGHYPLLFGIFSALEDDFFEDQVIPDYASAIIFEVTEDSVTGAKNFQVIYKSDSLTTTSKTVTVPLNHICSDATCDVADLSHFVADWDAERWCRVCDNDSTMACLRYDLDEEIKKNEELSSNPDPVIDTEDDGDDNDAEGLAAAVGFLIGMVVGGVIVCALVFCVMYARKAKHHKTALDQDKNVATTAMGKMGEDVSIPAFEETSSNGAPHSMATPPDDAPRTLD